MKYFTSLMGRWTIKTENQFEYFVHCRSELGAKGRKLFSVTPYHVKDGEYHLDINGYSVKPVGEPEDKDVA